MGKIVISENISLDGVIQDPTGEDGHERGGWFTRMGRTDREEWAKVELNEALGAEALLMGRRSYMWFVARGWPARTGAWADRLRSLPKYVVSSSDLDNPEWTNSTALTSEAVKEVATLKEQVDGEIIVYGSGQLAHTLMDHGLVDELRLMTCPVLVGAGERLFGPTRAVMPMRLVDTHTVGDGLALLTHQYARDAS
ncbi:dihydrofolate reductase family protein [Actinophytocola oryzae]|uniref:Dihydrofolate reductase n=1 Tax=Actinophytocola oryzae TaxID=502181 RepID=A0A4R7V4E2_9PSEU|nr:dihydrofolate reductase family protein [Actinophytocola oryzae]TDV44219.1 dihydrofolate reductase [Actinophytocola oryzae]